MKITELVSELSKFDENLEVRINYDKIKDIQYDEQFNSIVLKSY